ncbi:MAG: hypothetical protein AAF192_18970 [Pseudomonadota bacterium]
MHRQEPPSAPSVDAQADYVAKLQPVIEALLALPDFAGTRINFSRIMNLGMGHDPRTKAERAMQKALLRELRVRYPGEAYPAMAVRISDDGAPAEGGS